MSRVLHLVDTSGPGGAETVFVELATGLRAAGHECVALLPAEGWVADSLRARGVEPLFDRSAGSFDLGYLWRLVRLIRAERVDLVHAHLLTSSVYGSVAARLCGIPSIGTFHGITDLGRKRRFLEAKCRLLNWSASRIIFVSISLQDAFLSRTPLRPRSVAVIHNGIDLARFAGERDESVRSQLGAGAGDHLVVSVGNVRPAKGYEVLLRAARLVTDAGVRARFVVVGHQKEPLYGDLVALRASLGLDDVVQFAGFREDIGAVLSAADLFVLSSHSEGFSLSTVQAMAAGVPIVATRSGGPEEILLDRHTGRLVDVGDPHALGRAILGMLEDPAAARDLARNATAIAQRKFTLGAMLDRYSETYLELLPGSTRSPRVPASSPATWEPGAALQDRPGPTR